MEPVTLPAAFDSFDEQSAPRPAAEPNGQAVEPATVRASSSGTATTAPTMFLAVEGALTIELPDRADGHLEDGELVVPAGVEHRPVAETETDVPLFEPAGRTTTGGAGDERARDVERP